MSVARNVGSGESTLARELRGILERTGEGNPERRLDAVRRVAVLLGNPHRQYPVIHVTGTNGKTSTSRMTETLLRGHGLRTGLFTSPHLIRFNERIALDGSPAGDADLVRIWRRIEPAVTIVDTWLGESHRPRMTYFEVVTVLGFALFADRHVDVAVIEVGMGGEWDATNIADGDIAVITPISLDHTRFLGDTIAEIARVKSGIIKPGATVVSSVQDARALSEIRRATTAAHAHLLLEGGDFGVTADAPTAGGRTVDVRGLTGEYRDLFLPLSGAYQSENLAVAIGACEAFLKRRGRALDAPEVARGVARVTAPGRLQRVAADPLLLVDATHNPAGAAALADAVRQLFPDRAVGFVIGVMSDKDLGGILEHLSPVAGRFFATHAHTERALDCATLAARIGDVTPTAVESFPDPRAAVREALLWARMGRDRIVIVTGSIRLAGDVLRATRWDPLTPDDDLAIIRDTRAGGGPEEMAR